MNADSKVDILLVDDNPHNLLALESMLADLGENLVKARSGREALKLLLDQDFALILMDIRMPGMDGYEAAELIRQRERSRHIPIVFLTAFNMTEPQVFKGYSVGAVDFLLKPIVPEILKSKVSVFVELFKKTEEVKWQAHLLREAEARESEKKLFEARRKFEQDLLREEMDQERRLSEAMSQRADELERSIAERERAEEALRRSNERLTLLAETANRLLLGARPQEFIGSLFSRLSSHLHLEVYLNYLVQEDGASLRLDSYGGVAGEELAEHTVVAFGEGVSGLVAAERRPIISEDIPRSPDDPTTSLRVLGLTAYACYPLLADGRLLGTLSFGTRRRPSFHPDELQVMQVVCDQVAMALERARLIVELQKRAEELASADRRKDEFLAMLAHELRNPLAPMMNAVHLLNHDDGKNDAIRVRAIATAERQVRHMIRLVDDLLDVSRITNGKVQLRKQVVTLDAVVDHAVQTSRPILEDRRHELSIVMPPEPVKLWADPTRLAQVIANLLNNAGKYTDPGGSITLTCERRGALEGGLRSPRLAPAPPDPPGASLGSGPSLGAEVVIKVRDTGIGLAPEMLPRVFDMFVQSERGADRSQGGLGLGLTLVQQLVEMHGGSVAAHSEGVGRGSEFVVHLPIEMPAEANGAPVDEIPPDSAGPSWIRRSVPPVSSVPPPSPALRILVVEDNDDIRETLKDLLEMCGHQVDVAGDGASGVEQTLSLRPDVALIDIGLPGLDGYQVAQKIRAEMPVASTRLIALTGYGQPDDKRRALAAGFDAHLVKPVDFDDLKRLLAPPD
jgi:signal transduction histidine kinase